MPTLQWIGKEKVVSHHHDVTFRTLEHQYGFRVDDPDDTSETFSGNKIIHGDNLEALKALLPEYEGRVDCVYIDPPYNTGNEKWVYNDNVNDPQIRRWLNLVVGAEGEDLSRHDKWLCMMYPRLTLLRQLLSNDGAIFVSIGDDESAHLRLVLFAPQRRQGHPHRGRTPDGLQQETGMATQQVGAYGRDGQQVQKPRQRHNAMDQF